MRYIARRGLDDAVPGSHSSSLLAVRSYLSDWDVGEASTPEQRSQDGWMKVDGLFGPDTRSYLGELATK
jgi:hypothetical protein